MFRARPNSPNHFRTASLTRNVSSYLACGPLKIPEVMGALLGRRVVPEQKTVFSRGYELVILAPSKTTMRKIKNPIFLPNPADFNVMSFALYNDLTERELRIIAQYNCIGEMTEASLETSEFENHSLKHLIYRLREGVPSTQYHFPSEDGVFDEYEMEHLPVNDYIKEAARFKKRLDRQSHTIEGTSLPSRSRR